MFRVNMLLPSSMCQCCDRTHYLHTHALFHRDTLRPPPPQDMWIPTGGYAVVQLVEALRYKPEGGGFDSRWCHWNFSLV